MINTLYKYLNLPRCFILIVSFFVLFSVQAAGNYPLGLLSHGGFETGNIDDDFARKSASSVVWSFETDSPLNGARSLKANISNYGWVRSIHVPTEEQKQLSHIHLSGLIKSSANRTVEVVVTYEGNIYAENTRTQFSLPNTTELITLNLDAVAHDKPANKDKNIRTVAVYFKGTGEHVIDDIQLQFIEPPLSVSALASPELITSDITVNENVAIFTTDTPKTHTLPSCITAGNEQKWSVNAKGSSADNGLHTLINIAKNSNEPIEATPANNCDIAPGIEQASNVNIVYRQEDENENPINATVSSALNFVARTKVEVAEDETETPVVEFKLVENNIETNQWLTADSTGEHHQYSFGLLNAGSSYTLTTKVTLGSEIDESNITHFDVLGASATLFKDVNGDFYFKLPSGAFIHLSENNGVWTIDDTLTQAGFDALSLDISSDTTIEFGDFTGDGIQDFKLVTATEEIVFENNGSTYSKYEEVAINPSISNAPTLNTTIPSAVGETIGTMAGAFKVDESGNATYNVPISLPQGIAGVTPSLAFS